MESKFLGSVFAVIFGSVVLFAITVTPLADATPPCVMDSTTRAWTSYDNIYVGKVVSALEVSDDDKVHTTPPHPEWMKSLDAKINFELEHILKGNPPLQWHKYVPLESYCDHICFEGADYYSVGTEFFYMDDFNQDGVGFYPQGDCGLGAMTDQDQTAVSFLNYFEEIYDFPVPKFNPDDITEKTACSDDEHLLVARDNGKRVCVFETTAEKLGWEEITIADIYFESNPDIDVKYDYPLSSKDTQPFNGYVQPTVENEITISNLPKIGETGKIVVTYTNLVDDVQYYSGDDISFWLSDNFRFVGIDDELIGYNEFDNSTSFQKKIPSTKQHDDNVFSVEFEAVSPGFGYMSVSGGGAWHSFLLYVDKTQTLLNEDYYKNYYPRTDASEPENNR